MIRINLKTAILRRRRVDTLKFWAVFTVGVAAGATVALIYAPQSGEKTRKKIKRKLEDASDYLKDATGTLGDHAEKVVNRSKDAWEDLSDAASKAANKAAKTVSDRI
jgi:gas vesicle protein